MNDFDTLERKRAPEAPLHGPEGFAAMRRAGRLVAEALDMITEHVQPGVPTERIDQLLFDFAMDHGAYPATLYYRGYNKSCCTSINHVVCHGIPNDKPLRDGDIVNIDFTVILDGWHGDSSRMYYAGDVPRRAQRLCEITHESMMRGIAAIRPGGWTNEIGAAIQGYVEGERCSVVRDFCGHGVGEVFHDAPTILHYVEPAYNVELKPGMIFTVEPMVNLGRPHVKVLADGWTAVTRDRSLSAQFEHTIGVTETGVEIFTLSPKGLDKPPYGTA
jgi:methionyl aminopeptidase